MCVANSMWELFVEIQACEIKLIPLPAASHLFKASTFLHAEWGCQTQSRSGNWTQSSWSIRWKKYLLLFALKCWKLFSQLETPPGLICSAVPRWACKNVHATYASFAHAAIAMQVFADEYSFSSCPWFQQCKRKQNLARGFSSLIRNYHLKRTGNYSSWYRQNEDKCFSGNFVSGLQIWCLCPIQQRFNIGLTTDSE